MKRFTVACVAALGLSIFGSIPSAHAQYNPYGTPGGYGPYVRPPTVSPYLNLLNGGNAGINYYLLVRPEIEFRARQNQLEAALRGLETQRAAGLPGELEELLRNLNISDPLRGTGHPATFGDFQPYYNLRGGSRGPTGGSRTYNYLGR